MAKGKDKVAKTLLDLQPTAMLDLFLLYPDFQKSPETFFPIHNGSVFKKGIIWQGETYMPMGMEIEGFEVNADGRVNRPKIKISNADYYMSNILRNYSDLENGRIIRKRTFVEFLDDENFDGGNPFGSADNTAEISSQEYIISQKVQENKILVELELTSPLDLDNFEINHRRIMGKYCYWQYRGDGCQYQGVPMQTENGRLFQDISGNAINYNQEFFYGDATQKYKDENQYTTGDLVYIVNNRVSVHDPYGRYAPKPILSYYIAKTDVVGLSPDTNPKYWDKDGCNKKLSSCKLRFSEDGNYKRFLRTEEETLNIFSATGGDYDNYSLIPESQEEIKQVLTGDNWTLIFNITNHTKRVDSAKYLTTKDNSTDLEIQQRNSKFELIYKINESTKRMSSKNSIDFNGDLSKDSPVVFSKTSGTAFSIYEPKQKSITTANYFTGDGNIQADLSYVRFFSDSSPSNDVEGIMLWRKSLTQDEVDSIYRETVEGGLRLKPLGELNDSIKNSLVGWWTTPNLNGKYLINESDSSNNLDYADNQNQNFVKEDSYTFNLEESVETKEDSRFLPFGGFPGTDGFDFSRKI